MALSAQFVGMPSYGVVAARLLLAAVFLYSGQDKLRHWRASIGEVAELGMPTPALFAAATVATQIAGGLSVALGIGAAVGAALLAGFTIVATLLGHRFWLLHGSEARRELTTSLEHLAIVGGLVLVGVGALSPG
jgi:putative oxidoreductase